MNKNLAYKNQEDEKDPNDTTEHSPAARRASSGHERRTLPGSQVGFDYSSPSFRPFTGHAIVKQSPLQSMKRALLFKAMMP
jgi:hypothetical protein